MTEWLGMSYNILFIQCAVVVIVPQYDYNGAVSLRLAGPVPSLRPRFFLLPGRRAFGSCPTRWLAQNFRRHEREDLFLARTFSDLSD